MKERDCANCKHHSKDGCSKWDCEFEATDLISRADAIEAVHEYFRARLAESDGEWNDELQEYVFSKEDKRLLEYNKGVNTALKALPSADAVPIHEDGTLEVKVPNAQKVGRVLVMDTDSHIGGGLFYPDDAVDVAHDIPEYCLWSQTYTNMVQSAMFKASADAEQGDECDHCVYKWGTKGGDDE